MILLSYFMVCASVLLQSLRIYLSANVRTLSNMISDHSISVNHLAAFVHDVLELGESQTLKHTRSRITTFCNETFLAAADMDCVDMFKGSNIHVGATPVVLNELCDSGISDIMFSKLLKSMAPSTTRTPTTRQTSLSSLSIVPRSLLRYKNKRRCNDHDVPQIPTYDVCNHVVLSFLEEIVSEL